MKNLMLALAIFIAAPAFAQEPEKADFDWAKVERDLAGEGAVGWVHGAVNELGLYVFTVRHPDFFTFGQMSLVTKDEAIKKFLESTSRHDKVRVKGKFMENPSPFHHVEIVSIEMVEEYESGHTTDPYPYEAKLPDDLLNRERARFLVHAIAEGGKILVVEYKDTTMPIFVRTPEMTKDLYRNDVIELAYTIQRHPDRPTHVRINARADTPVTVVESMKAKHETEAKATGQLIMFPKSPEIIFNVFAMLETTPDGLKRQYTLVNFTDMEKFKAIREALQAAWDRHPGEFVNGRNKLVSKNISVRVRGIYNVVDAGQANPQVLLNSVDDIEISDNGEVVKPFVDRPAEGIILPKSSGHNDEAMHPSAAVVLQAVSTKFQCEEDYKKAAGFWKHMGKYFGSKYSGYAAAIGAGAGAGSCLDDDFSALCTSGKQVRNHAMIGAAVGYVGLGALYAGISKHDITKAAKVVKQILEGKDGQEALEFKRDVRQAYPVENEEIEAIVRTMDAERGECQDGKVLDYYRLVEATKAKIKVK